MSTLIGLFVDFSCLHINRANSAFVGFVLYQEKELQCSSALGTLIGSLLMKYLGLPLQGGSTLEHKLASGY